MEKKLQGRTALVTGASSGIGKEIARELARLGSDIILVARRKNALDKLALELQNECGIKVTVMPTDLTKSEEREQLFKEILKNNIQVDLLINNAGFGLFGKYLDMDWNRLNDMLQVNVTAVTHLTSLFTPLMVERRWGRILMIASNAAYQPIPMLGAYAASKAYVVSLGVSLNYELRNTGVSCTTVSPGDTATEFYDVSDQPQTEEQARYFFTSEQVARISTEALLAQRPLVVTGLWNSLLAWGARLIPETWSAAIAYRVVTGQLSPLARLNNI
jgi:short-subunit dehydrogenase